MNVFVAHLAALHQQELLDEARLERRARLSARTRPSVPAWRRSLGAALASAARSVDPLRASVDEASLPGGHGASALPAC